MMRDVIDLIGINLEFAKRLISKIETSNSLQELDAESREQLNLIVTSGNNVISSVLENMNHSLEKDQMNTALLKEQWLKLFEITTQLTFQLPKQEDQSTSASSSKGLLQRFHSYFFSFSNQSGLTQQEKSHREGI